MKKIKYKSILIILLLGIVGVIIYGVYYLQTSLNNIQFSKNDAHRIVLQEFQGTVLSSEVEYEDAKVVYQFVVQDKQSRLVDVEVSARTGEIINFEYETYE